MHYATYLGIFSTFILLIAFIALIDFLLKRKTPTAERNFDQVAMVSGEDQRVQSSKKLDQVATFSEGEKKIQSSKESDQMETVSEGEKKIQPSKKYYPSFKVIFIGILILTALPAFILLRSPFGVVIGGFITYLYFLPYLHANKKGHTQTRAIYILNLFAGWTFIGWFVALVWSCTEPKETRIIQQNVQVSNADELLKYKNLLDSGVITQEEFEDKKKQLLNNK